MQLVLTVEGENRTALGANATGRLSAEGGMIGRDPRCNWVLPDDSRVISSQHLRVTPTANGFAAVDVSRNGTLLNGARMPQGGTAALDLTSGDWLQIGPYVIAVQIETSSPSLTAPTLPPETPLGLTPPVTAPRPMPAGDLPDLDLLGLPPLIPPQIAPPHMAPPHMAPPHMAPPHMVPPHMAPPQMSPAPMAPPPLAAPPMAPISEHMRLGSVSASLSNALLDDAGDGVSSVDPISLLTSAPRPGPASGDTGRPMIGRHDLPSGDDPLTGLFDEEKPGDAPNALIDPPAPARDPLASLPLEPIAYLSPVPGGYGSTPAAAISAPSQLPGLGRSDPLSASSGGGGSPAGTPPAAPPPVPQAGPGRSIIPDDWMPDLGLPQSPPSLPPPLSAPQPTGRGLVGAPLSAAAPTSRPVPESPLVTTSVETSLALLKAREAARGTGLAATSMAPAAAVAAWGPPTNAGPAAPVSGQAAALPQAAASHADIVLAALWEALGVDPTRLSPEDQRRFLAEVGRATRQTAEGLIQVLAARRSLKDEIRADQTLMQATENNLFKFTRTAEEMLALAATNRNRVFLPLDQAVSTAFNDIKAHEIATISGVHMAIRAMLDRFQPAKVMKQAMERKQGMFGWTRSKGARAWAFFSKSYAALAMDADEASNQIFKVEFGRAYREQVEKTPGR